jgi:predicted unusual protein kinase regulating ubiquinone biosynthesis (AarF/ABC1/UbiB family)
MKKDETENGALDGLARGFRDRTMVAAKLAGKMGVSYLKRAVRGGPAQDQAADREKAITAALELVEQVGKLKGLAMKVGQIASYMPGAFPPEAQRVLAQLQVKSQPMRFDLIQGMVERELGAPLSQLFDDFEREPMAAASIGQVHRATFQGRRVAVKVQYPEIEELVGNDLKLVGMLSRLLVIGTANDGEALAKELRDRMLEECDYGLEAKRQKLFRELYAKIPNCRVPEVIDARSSRRVLTTELVDGVGFDAFADSATQEEKNRAGVAIFNAVFQTLFKHAIYNGDPHPGNYLFDREGNVTFLDFGCVREFSADFMGRWKPMERAMHARDRAGVRKAFPATGMMGVPEHKFDWDMHWQVMEYVCRPYQPPQPFTFTQEWVAESYDKVLFNAKAMTMIATPPEWLLINRVHWGLNSVLARLHATSDWGTHWHGAIWSDTTPIPCR